MVFMAFRVIQDMDNKGDFINFRNFSVGRKIMQLSILSTIFFQLSYYF